MKLNNGSSLVQDSYSRFKSLLLNTIRNTFSATSLFNIRRRGAQVVGVHITSDSLRLSLVTSDSTGKQMLVNYRRESFQFVSATRSPAETAEQLKTALKGFLTGAKKIVVWSAFDSERLIVRQIQIPKVVKKQIPNSVYWTFKREYPFDDKEMIFDYEVEGEIIEGGVTKIGVTGYLAPRAEVDQVRQIFESSGFPLLGITSPIFAVRNIFKTSWIPLAEKTCIFLYIDDLYSRITVFTGKISRLTRGIKAGAQTLIEALRKELGENIDPRLARELILSLGSDQAVAMTQLPKPLTKDEIFEMIRPPLDRLIRQIERTLQFYRLSLPKEGLKFIFLAGYIGACKPIVDYIGEQLGMEISIIDPFQSGRLDAGLVPPTDLSERVNFAAAVGLGLSDVTYTPNLVDTYKDKVERVKETKINRVVVSFFAALALIVVFAFTFQLATIARERSKKTDYQNRLERFVPRVSQDMIKSSLGDVVRRQQLLKRVDRRYLPVAVIGELCSITPANIRLIDLYADFGPPSKDKNPDAMASVTIDGVITGNEHQLESYLAEYLLKLEGSPLFQKASISSSSIVTNETGQIMLFKIVMENERRRKG